MSARVMIFIRPGELIETAAVEKRRTLVARTARLHTRLAATHVSEFSEHGVFTADLTWPFLAVLGELTGAVT